MKLAISLASRGRPEQLIGTINRSIANWTNEKTELWVQADEDDEETCKALRAFVQDNFQKRVRISVMPREDTIAAKWNRILRQVPDADVYSVAADDDPYVSKGYDDSILRAAARFPDGIGMVYGWLANLSFTGSLSATRKWCDILGYLQPEHFPYWFCDHWTDDLARLTGRIAFSDHRTDQTKIGATQEMREPAWWATFYDACYDIRRTEATKLLAACDCPESERNRLLLNAPLIGQRSFGVNSHVRQMKTTPGLRLDDPRYQRVKAKAIEIVKHELSEMHEQQRAAYEAMLFPTPIPNFKQVGA